MVLRSLVRLALFVSILAIFTPVMLALAHSFNAADIKINHPYATPTSVGVRNGAVYFRSIHNNGKKADRLLSARTDIADRIELHHMLMDGTVMRMREVASISLPPGDGPSFRNGQTDAYHLMLINLKTPLKEGDRFNVWLKFENSGEKEVTVKVQKSKETSHEHH